MLYMSLPKATSHLVLRSDLTGLLLIGESYSWLRDDGVGCRHSYSRRHTDRLLREEKNHNPCKQ